MVYAHSKLHRDSIMEEEDRALQQSAFRILANSGPELLENVVKQGDFTTEDLLNLTRTSKAFRNAAAPVLRKERAELQTFIADPPPTFEEIVHRLQTRRKTAGGIRYAPGTTVQQVLRDIINQRYAQYGDDGPPDRVFISDLLAVLYSIYVANPSCAPTFEPYELWNPRLGGLGYMVYARQRPGKIVFDWPETLTVENRRTFEIRFNKYFEMSLETTHQLFLPEKPRVKMDFPGLRSGNYDHVLRVTHCYTVTDLIKAYYDLNKAIEDGTVPPNSITIRYDARYLKKELLITLLEQSGVFYDTTDVGGNPVVNARASFIDLALL